MLPLNATTRRDAVAPVTSDADLVAPRSTIETGLTEREYQVLNLLAARHTYGEIGHELYISVNTVKTHVSHLYAKLGVNNRSAAIRRTQRTSLTAPNGDHANEPGPYDQSTRPRLIESTRTVAAIKKNAEIETDVLDKIVRRLRATRLSLLEARASTPDQSIDAHLEHAADDIEQTIRDLPPPTTK